MKIVESKVDNPIYKKVIFTMGYPYAKKQIARSSDKELIKDLNMIYNRLQPYFEKKQLKDSIDEANRLSDIKVPDFLSKKVGNYF
jgi:hypothetical protein